MTHAFLCINNLEYFCQRVTSQKKPVCLGFSRASAYCIYVIILFQYFFFLLIPVFKNASEKVRGSLFK